MDKEPSKGAAEKIEGAIKDTVGSVTGNRKLQCGGKAEKVGGAAPVGRRRQGRRL